MTRPRYREQPMRCECMHVADTPEWHGSVRSGAGLSGHSTPVHLAACVHSELRLTTTPLAKRRSVRRLTLAELA